MWNCLWGHAIKSIARVEYYIPEFYLVLQCMGSLHTCLNHDTLANTYGLRIFVRLCCNVAGSLSLIGMLINKMWNEILKTLMCLHICYIASFIYNISGFP